MFINFRTLSERGDTLVEVLIAIAVISLILGGAFVTTNRNLQNTRQAQERGNAQKLVESQIEQLKNVIATNPTSIFGSGAPASFCINAVGAVVASSNAACAVNAAGTATTIEPIYRLVATRSGNTFTVNNTWSKLTTGGGTTNNVQMKYRVYEQ
jgi:prepilin-type N-terminal cleavage/methylation domain-containing protein